MEPHLDVDLEWRGRTVVLAPRGAVDLFTAPLLGERIAEAAADGATGLDIDLSGLRFIDSSGLGVLLDASRTFPGAMSLWGAAGLVRRVLEVAASAPALNEDDRRFARVFAPTGTLSR